MQGYPIYVFRSGAISDENRYGPVSLWQRRISVFPLSAAGGDFALAQGSLRKLVRNRECVDVGLKNGCEVSGNARRVSRALQGAWPGPADTVAAALSGRRL